jgi:hypothetical protein
MNLEAVPDSYDLEEDIDPYEWQESLEESFLSFYREEVPDGYTNKADRAGEVFDERPTSLDGWPIDPRGTTQAYLDGEDIDAGTLYDAAVDDLLDVLYGQVQSRAMDGDDVEPFRRRIERFEQAFDRLEPDFYADTGDHEYTVRRPDGPEEVFGLGRELGTCIGFDVSYDAFEGSEVGEMLAESIEDPHTLYLVVERDGEPAGFSRNLVLEEDETGEHWLAIDTLELDRDEYEDERDALKPLAVGSIQAGLDAGVDAVGVVASEGSAKEVIDGYGGSRTVAYEKVGESVRMTSTLDGEAGERTLHPLMEDPERS